MTTTERLTIVSSDCHAGAASMIDYREFLDPEFRSDYDEYCAAIDAYEAATPSGLSAGGATSTGLAGLWDAAIRTRCLDDDGVAAEVIFAQGSIPFGVYPAVGGGRKLDFTATPAQIAAGCRAYNRWLADLCEHDSRRHLGIARVPLPDIHAAVEEVEFAAKLGLRGGVHMPPLTTPDMPFLNDPAYEPFWAVCEAHRMTLNMHGGANVDYGRGPENFLLTLAEVDWLSHRGLSHMILSGVFERHPGLHLAMTEQRTHWVHQLIEELDSVYGHASRFGMNGSLPRKPSEYFLENCFIGASFLSRPECDARGELGSHCFMWGSDYPHNEGTWPYTDQALRHTIGSADVPLDEMKALLAGNAARCYHLDLDELLPVAEKIGPSEADLRVPVEVLPGEGPGEAPIRSWAFRRHGPWH